MNTVSVQSGQREKDIKVSLRKDKKLSTIKAELVNLKTENE